MGDGAAAGVLVEVEVDVDVGGVAAVGLSHSRGPHTLVGSMPLLRRLSVVLLCLALFGAGVGPVRAQTDLQDAKNEAEDAKDAGDSARSSVRVQRAQLGETGAALAVAFSEFQARTEELERLTLTIATVGEEIRSIERALAGAREQALDQAVEVYTSAVAGTGLISLFVGSSPADAVIAAGILDDFAQAERSHVANYTALRSDLDRRKADLDVSRGQFAEAREAAEATKRSLESLYSEVAEELAAAEARVRAADAAYAQALDSIEKERRRLALLRGAESWRSLVEIYFTEDLVQEALAIIQCESRGNTDAVNPTSGASGLFQFLESTWSWASVEAGFPGSSRFDPEANVAAAAWLVDVSIQTDHEWGRWGHWACRRVIYPMYSNGLTSDAEAHAIIPPVAKLEDDVVG